jgi:GNAT superfamily N-acetyltransferase
MRVVTANLREARELLRKELVIRGFDAYEDPTNKYLVRAHDFTTQFSLSFMPGNRRTLISHAVSVHPEYRGKGLGTRNCELREDAARDAGVTLMLATVLDANVAEIRVLEKRSWVRFTQNKSTHCSLWGKIL